MNGRRVYPDDKGIIVLQCGDYAFDPTRCYWVVKTPNGHIGCLKNHKVEAHDDGTITVNPSIAIRDGESQLWHGWLEKGIWRKV